MSSKNLIKIMELYYIFDIILSKMMYKSNKKLKKRESYNEINT